jgi:acetyl-CoA carboxylase biotin carboxyl carrier protein
MARKNKPRSGEGGAGWDLKQIRELIDLLIDRQVGEFELERGGLRIHIRRGMAEVGAGPAVQLPAAALPDRIPPPAPLAPPAPEGVTAPAEPTTEEAAEGLYIVKSPIVGTFYASPAPNAPPFVKPGDGVRVGQVLCIIEAMKLMNEIESEVAGEIVRIYVENGQPVEYGQSLFAITPSHKK